jgi:hypothetical protein
MRPEDEYYIRRLSASFPTYLNLTCKLQILHLAESTLFNLVLVLLIFVLTFRVFATVLLTPTTLAKLAQIRIFELL